MLTVWADNNLVKILSNFHQPKRVVNKIRRRKRDNKGRHEREPSFVPCPVQVGQQVIYNRKM